MNGKTDCKDIPDVLLHGLSEYLTAKIGFHFTKKRWNELHPKMAAAMIDFGFEDIGKFIEWLLSSSPTQKQIEILASHLTVVKPISSEREGHLKSWSRPCCQA